LFERPGRKTGLKKRFCSLKKLRLLSGLSDRLIGVCQKYDCISAGDVLYYRTWHLMPGIPGKFNLH